MPSMVNCAATMKAYSQRPFLACLSLAVATSWSQTPDGVWSFDKAIDCEGLNASPKAPPAAHLKSGEDEEAIAGFLSKQFS